MHSGVNLDIEVFWTGLHYRLSRLRGVKGLYSKTHRVLGELCPGKLNEHLNHFASQMSLRAGWLQWQREPVNSGMYANIQLLMFV